MTPNVIGRRVSSKGMPPGLALYAAAVVLVVLSVSDFIGGDTAFGVLYAVGGLVAALVGKTFAGDAKRTTEIASACPVCGVERQRQFIAWRNEPEPPGACGACIAYLRVSPGSLEVREEAIDATGIYVVTAAQYGPSVPRTNDEEHRFKFVMPTMCAVCGAADAPLLRTLDPMLKPDAGIAGDVVSAAASEAIGARVDRTYKSNILSSAAELDLLLSDVEMHVCAKHTAITDRGVEYSDGDLVFRTYRYYKAFCELNHITAATMPSEAPTARVVSS